MISQRCFFESLHSLGDDDQRLLFQKLEKQKDRPIVADTEGVHAKQIAHCWDIIKAEFESFPRDA